MEGSTLPGEVKKASQRNTKDSQEFTGRCKEAEGGFSHGMKDKLSICPREGMKQRKQRKHSHSFIPSSSKHSLGAKCIPSIRGPSM